MTLLADLSRSLRGWAEVLAGKRGAADNFRTDTGRLIAAALTLLAAILLSVAAQSMGAGLPGTLQIVFGLLAQAITVALLALAISWVTRFLALRVGLNALLVPILYALSYMFVLGVPLLLIGPNAALIALFGLALLIWRAGVVLGGMTNGLAVAFAVLCVIVLVVVPNALYMLLLLVPSA